MKRILWLLLAWGSIAQAQQAIPVYELNTQETYVRAPVDQQLYSYSRDQGLSDLWVRDSKGNNLPFRIVNYTGSSQDQLEEMTIPFFPIAPNTQPEVLQTLSSTRIQIKSDQVQVDVQPDIQTIVVDQPPEFYLVDLQAAQKQSRGSDRIFKSLSLEWKENQKQYQSWSIYGSNDLRNWDLLRDVSLIRLEKDGFQLVQQQIQLQLEPDRYAYLKLACKEFCNGLTLTQVTLQQEFKSVFIPAPMQWSVKGTSVSSKAVRLHDQDNWQAASAWEFHREDVAQADKVKIDFGENSFGDRIRLLAKNRKQDPWVLVYQGIWFNARVGNTWRSSDAVPINSRQTFWRLESATALVNPPELLFSMPPKWVEFVANQSPPYQLVIDPGTDSAAQTSILESLLRDHSPSWINHEWRFLNPPKPYASLEISWKTLLFWSVMILAVLLLAVLSLKLFRQMNTSVNPESEDSYKK